MKQPAHPASLADLATQALEVVVPRASLFRRSVPLEKRVERLSSLRIQAIRAIENGASDEIEELANKGAVLLVCGIDDALTSFSGRNSDGERLLLSSRKKLESARYTLEAISK
jgi:hypothetical protein